MKEKMTDYWICKNYESCSNPCNDHITPHELHHGCTIECFHKNTMCEQMTMAEYAVWRLTHSKEVV